MKQQHRTAVAFGFLICITITPSQCAPLDDDSLEIHNLEEIRTILTDLIDSGITIDLDEHQYRFIKGDAQNRVLENFLFTTGDGASFTLSAEKVLDKNYQPKVVSYLNVDDDDAQKVLLSLLGGGNIKSLVVKK